MVGSHNLVIGEKQQEIYDAYFSGEFKVVVVLSGRQAGKTYGAVHIESDWILEGEPGSMYWVTASGQKHVKAVYRRLRRVLRGRGVPERDLQIHNSNQDLSIRYRPLDTLIDFRTCRDQGALVSETVSGVHIDEAGRITDPRIFWEDIIPATAVKGATILITGTPKPEAKWYRRLFLSGLEGSPHFGKAGFPVKTIQMDARDNPDGEAIVAEMLRYEEMAKAGTYPMDTYRQEWLGEWVGTSGEVFSNIDEAVLAAKSAEARNYYDVPHHNLVLLDVGTTADYAGVAVVADRLLFDPMSGKTMFLVKYVEQLPHMDYVRMTRRVHSIAEDWGEKYPARVLADGTGLPDVTKKTIGATGLRLHWHDWNADNRADAIGHAQAFFATKRIGIPDDDNLLEQLVGFTAKELPNGKFKIEAGPGLHDDVVMSILLGVYYLARRFRIMRFHSDEYAERAKVRLKKRGYDPHVGPESDSKLAGTPIREPKLRRSRRGRSTGFFDG